jgi:RNA polymerase sigma-70 factor (ECF subfamily)
MSADPDWLQRDEDFLMAMASMAVPAYLRAKFDMEDVVQDALLKVHRNADALTGRSAAERQAYLKKALASVLADQIRRYHSRGRGAGLERSLEAALDDSSARLSQWLAADQTSPSQRASREEQLFRLTRALARLPEDQRQAVQHHHLTKLSLAETARTMNRTEHAVAGLIRRALQALRRMLLEGDASRPDDEPT